MLNPSYGDQANGMFAAPNGTALAETVLAAQLLPEVIQKGVQEVQDALLAHSDYIRTPCFTAIHPRDLEFLFASYDERFFGGLCGDALGGRCLTFRLPRRMTRAGGSTSRLTTWAAKCGSNSPLPQRCFSSVSASPNVRSPCAVLCVKRGCTLCNGSSSTS
jgi:hypothetical protein